LCITLITYSLTPRPIISLSSIIRTTSTPVISTLSLHDALPILAAQLQTKAIHIDVAWKVRPVPAYIMLVIWGEHTLVEDFEGRLDRKSTRLNSSHQIISYAVFCLKKKKSINKKYSM